MSRILLKGGDRLVKGLVSVIMPTYNCAKFIAESMDSVIAQTYTHWELCIVDDCSTDNTKAIVEEYMAKDARIRYRRLEVNAGASAARTQAMEMAEGEYMAFCDSDDLWLPEKLEHQMAFMQQNGYAFSATAYEHIDTAGEKLGRVVKTVDRVDYDRLLLDCPVGNSTVMYHVETMGKFKVPDIRRRNDDALWLQMLKKERYIYGLPEVLMQYRVRENSISRNKLKLIKYHWILYREIEHLNVFRSAFHIFWWCFMKVFRIK
ncbi:MAG: glycosyltransferase family 2 protein [Clostridia bacterium]|nr:glycosyltransferase family 2 protein [Clostridia bacterium]